MRYAFISARQEHELRQYLVTTRLYGVEFVDAILACINENRRPPNWQYMSRKQKTNALADTAPIDYFWAF